MTPSNISSETSKSPFGSNRPPGGVEEVKDEEDEEDEEDGKEEDLIIHGGKSCLASLVVAWRGAPSSSSLVRSHLLSNLALFRGGIFDKEFLPNL